MERCSEVSWRRWGGGGGRRRGKGKGGGGRAGLTSLGFRIRESGLATCASGRATVAPFRIGACVCVCVCVYIYIYIYKDIYIHIFIYTIVIETSQMPRLATCASGRATVSPFRLITFPGLSAASPPGFRVSGFGFWVSGFGFRVLGFGFRVSG
jgi:hypothetical protein